MISASMAEHFTTKPICLEVIAPVAHPATASLLARNFSNVFLIHERREIGWRFLGAEVSVLPGFGIGMHLAIFQGGGNAP